MTILQEQAIQMICGLSDDNVGFLIEIIQRLMPQKTHVEVVYPSVNSTVSMNDKMKAFQSLEMARSEIKSYLPADFDPEKELEEARRERYGSID